jgi:hypothetical protein
MGIFVSEAYLPMGITLSNVYMSFSGEVIYTCPRNGQYNVNTHYKVYKDDTKQPDTNIRIPLNVQVSDISVGVYTTLYTALKELYPGAEDAQVVANVWCWTSHGAATSATGSGEVTEPVAESNPTSNVIYE